MLCIDLGRLKAMELEGRAGGVNPEWAIADARHRGKFIAAAMLAADRLEKKALLSVLLGGDILWG